MRFLGGEKKRAAVKRPQGHSNGNNPCPELSRNTRGDKMTLAKAIEILSREVHDITLSPDPDVPAALAPGIEALKRIKSQLNSTKKGGKLLLPGETKERR